MRLHSSLLVALCLAGCATAYPRPMTVQDLARLDTGEALVAYLRQPDASPAVCDPRTAGPHITPLDGGAMSVLVDGLIDGRIDPGLWGRCVEGALEGSSPEAAASLV